ncbi:Hypothetical protein I595_2397 [Croceitalea dokdonensis DOKDO 023]|uniref:Uncharacterized protein n=1 Tax=Croceitalea dokdonensis DOKDO 023 TaxID=1300341 RepID=A0A0N8H3P3_9FLAO|nr:Hypothetical protein I595_2397 [Croceitalea dokdonensis DOKDO 023]
MLAFITVEVGALKSVLGKQKSQPSSNKTTNTSLILWFLRVLMNLERLIREGL